MKLPDAADPHAPVATAPAAALAPNAAQARAWKLHLQRAASGFAGAEAPHPAPEARRDAAASELETCGAPSLAAAPALPAAPPSPAHSGAHEEPLLPTRASEREPERSPVRLHLQSAPAEGVKVWLGIDGDATLVAQRASAAVADLRRSLHSTGERLAAVVCNGVPFVARASSSPQPPSLKDPP